MNQGTLCYSTRFTGDTWGRKGLAAILEEVKSLAITGLVSKNGALNHPILNGPQLLRPADLLANVLKFQEQYPPLALKPCASAILCGLSGETLCGLYESKCMPVLQTEPGPWCHH